MLGFDERDLLRWSEEAGLVDLRLHLEATVSSTHPWAGSDLDAVLDTSPNPLSASLREMLDAALQPDERQRLVERFRSRLDDGEPARSADAVVYLTARRPA